MRYLKPHVIALLLLMLSGPVPAFTLDSSGTMVKDAKASDGPNIITCPDTKLVSASQGATKNHYGFSGECVMKTFVNGVLTKTTKYDVDIQGDWVVSGKKVTEKTKAVNQDTGKTELINATLTCQSDPWLNQTKNVCNLQSVNGPIKGVQIFNPFPLSRFMTNLAEVQKIAVTETGEPFKLPPVAHDFNSPIKGRVSSDTLSGPTSSGQLKITSPKKDQKFKPADSKLILDVDQTFEPDEVLGPKKNTITLTFEFERSDKGANQYKPYKTLVLTNSEFPKPLATVGTGLLGQPGDYRVRARRTNYPNWTDWRNYVVKDK